MLTLWLLPDVMLGTLCVFFSNEAVSIIQYYVLPMCLSKNFSFPHCFYDLHSYLTFSTDPFHRLRFLLIQDSTLILTNFNHKYNRSIRIVRINSRNFHFSLNLRPLCRKIIEIEIKSEIKSEIKIEIKSEIKSETKIALLKVKVVITKIVLRTNIEARQATILAGPEIIVTITGILTVITATIVKIGTVVTTAIPIVGTVTLVITSVMVSQILVIVRLFRHTLQQLLQMPVTKLLMMVLLILVAENVIRVSLRPLFLHLI